MIKVEVEYRGKGFHSLKIKGHANSGDYGKDLVCAGVSAVSIGALNAFEDPDDYDIDIESGLIECIAKAGSNDHDEVVIETMLIQLKTIAASYPQAIEIKERKI